MDDLTSDMTMALVTILVATIMATGVTNINQVVVKNQCFVS